jgi:DNA primase
MRIPLEFYNHLRNIVPISDIVRQRLVLVKKGNEYLGICPFHDEKTPSFTVNDVKRFYHCFGCSAHGDVIRFVSETNGISYKESAIKIAKENGIELPKMSAVQERVYEEADQIYNILNLASEFFKSKLDEASTNYLNKRGVTLDSIESFSIGFAPGGGELEKFFEQKSIPLKDLLKSGLFGKKEDGRIYEVFNKRIMFPIHNVYNKIVGFGGRAIGDVMPKYINSPETAVFKKSETMYGENVATGQAYKDNYFIVVEGYMDVIALHQAGFKQTVASLGTSVTEGHIQKLWRSADEIIACLDGDNAGVRASGRLVNMALPQISANKLISFIAIPNGTDPDDLIKDKGSNAFKSLLDIRIGLSEMIWKMEFSGKSFKTAESKSQLEKKLDEYSSQIQDSSLKANFKRYFKEMIWDKLVKRKSKKESNTINSEDISASKKYSEIEYMEKTICSFMLKFPNIIRSLDDNISFQDTNLSDFKDWIVDIANENKDLDKNLIADKVKNTRFSDSYLVLSSSGILFLDYSFLNNETVDQEQVLEWLCKKHYLLLLKNEYAGVLKNNTYSEQSKAASYIEEIRRVTKELNQLSENFINN